MIRKALVILTTIGFISCGENLPEIKPDIITEFTLHDTDDPAIWVNAQNTQESIVFGTDKETDGAIYAFNLDGKIIEEKTLHGMKRPNNVDVEYNVKLNDSVTTDILMFTEREREQIRLFSVPDMKPLDQGGFKVFQEKRENEWNLPMGISIYKSPKTDKTYAIVGRKNGPKINYLQQFELVPAGDHIEFKLVREFGKFSAEKEIEAIAVDEELGYIYYSDEMVCVRKYNAEPDASNEELSCFGGEYFNRDIEGIAIAKYNNQEGYIIVSNQQEGTFNFFDRKTNQFLYAKNLGTVETDGCEVYTGYLNEKFPNGLFVAMNDNKNFYFYDLSKIIETK
ncbi:3-phytase [Mesonia phycicola]|uniref:3-phytase n=1 Tax=Mesonia phycicola TaxID=579105 RepID=A0A1M6CMM1_9FLAO|nr:phytase [Mesonia phycicola]SHI62240.1 3-phytase [Mesonia phycicola]